MYTVFLACWGETTPNPTLDDARELVFEKSWDLDCAFWASDRPLLKGKTLVIRDGIKSLSLILKVGCGWFLTHGIVGDDDYVAIKSTDYTRTVTVYMCGQPWVVPRAFFLPRRTAWNAVKEFLLTGERTSKLNWVELGAQEWDDTPRE